ncbi:RimK/LysX family protein [Cyclobacterium sp. 1_MG-2023]|uniref:ATP-dependent zinc protease family protein n=1 Tax=Cyclobacterium sp. 1_MG-2023 TaxID=3062681 RepID=UPI0026E309A8|nr:RimK/LysX family protein [Cyclobacterium sp. 1_MG-2023]MDO6439527.1 RimK/LysX family protein [Cyclobacterium sp. 1_MG-2023]
MEKTIIGRKEKIDLPEWNITAINAKIDTGAYNCSIHVTSVKEVLKDNRKELEVILLDPEDERFTGKTINIINYKIKKVKNSFGQIEKRFLIKTMMTLGGQQFKAGFTLSDRGKMKNNVLLGRKILAGRFLVDVEKVNLTKAE